MQLIMKEDLMPRIMKSMNAISRCQAIYRVAKLPSDLVSYHHSLILNICHVPGRSQDDYARELCLSKSSVTRALALFEERGLITRVTNPEDKRETLVYPTDEMKKLYPEVKRISKEWTMAISEDITDDEFRVFESVLVRLEARARELAEVKLK